MGFFAVSTEAHYWTLSSNRRIQPTSSHSRNVLEVCFNMIFLSSIGKKKKGKAIPVTGRGGP
jgi:hypothetical protein